jgi:hypothetical protein
MDDGAKPEPLKKFSELVDCDSADRTRHQLRILEGMMANAIKEKAWDDALKIFEKAQEMLRRSPCPTDKK